MRQSSLPLTLIDPVTKIVLSLSSMRWNKPNLRNNLHDLLGFLEGSPELADNLEAVRAYRAQYGVSA